MGSEWMLGDWLGGCGLDSTVSGHGPLVGCWECGDEPSGSCATELVCNKRLVRCFFFRLTMWSNELFN
jgi:hypothetical protein